MRHSPVVGAGIWGFCKRNSDFPHISADFRSRYPNDRTGFLMGHNYGFCGDWSVTTARRPVGDPFSREKSLSAAHLPPKKNGLFPFTS